MHRGHLLNMYINKEKLRTKQRTWQSSHYKKMDLKYIGNETQSHSEMQIKNHHEYFT